MRSELILVAGLATVLMATHARAQEAPPTEPPPTEPAPVPAEATPPAQAPPEATPAPAPAAAAAAPAAAAPAPRHRAAPPHGDEPSSFTASRALFVALEVGQASFADANNIYNDGAGRGLLVALGPLELHFEQYDLVDQTKAYVNVAHADGIASITSLAFRFDLLGSKRLSLSALVGPTLVSRPSMITDSVGVEYPIPGVVDTARSPQSQWGIGAIAGIGLQAFGVIYADLRAYPVVWGDELGTRLESHDGATTMVMMTHDNTPGGVPITMNVGVGYSFD